MSHRTAGRLAWSMGAIALSLLLVGDGFGLPAVQPDFGEYFLEAMFLALLVVFAAVGALIASRQPRNPIGWIFCAIAVCIGLGGLADGYTDYWLDSHSGSQGVGELATWYANIAFAPDLIVPVIFLPLLFPDGRLLSARWRPVAWAGAVGFVMYGTFEALKPGPLRRFPELQNPYGIDSPVVDLLGPVATTLLVVALLAAPLSLVLRFRRSAYEQRQQIKWLAWAGALAAATLVAALSPLRGLLGDFVMIVAAVISVLGLPLAAGVAILRYRLYEIDVVINRTLVYGALTATLAVTYLACVLLLQLVLSPVTSGSGLAVTVSTLAVAALFRPARHRIQAAVDRRFYRRKYDTQRTLERFGARLRDEVDLAALGSELRGVVADTMQPAHVTLWLRSPEPER